MGKAFIYCDWNQSIVLFSPPSLFWLPIIWNWIVLGDAAVDGGAAALAGGCSLMFTTSKVGWLCWELSHFPKQRKAFAVGLLSVFLMIVISPFNLSVLYYMWWWLIWLIEIYFEEKCKLKIEQRHDYLEQARLGSKLLVSPHFIISLIAIFSNNYVSLCHPSLMSLCLLDRLLFTVIPSCFFVPIEFTSRPHDNNSNKCNPIRRYFN